MFMHWLRDCFAAQAIPTALARKDKVFYLECANASILPNGNPADLLTYEIKALRLLSLFLGKATI